jgi:hypothetical protein
MSRGPRLHPRQPEVGDPRAPSGVEQDVGRLQVAMDDPPLVRRLHRPRHLFDHLRRLARRQRRAAQLARQAAAGAELQGEVGQPLVRAVLVDLDYPQVLDGGNRLRPGQEPRPRLRPGVAAGRR